MKRLQMLLGYTLIGSLALLNSNSAWSESPPEVKPTKAMTNKAKKAKSKAKSAKHRAHKATLTSTQPVSASTNNAVAAAPAATAAVVVATLTTNPYLPGQPAVATPIRANPYLANRTPVAAQIAAVPSVASQPQATAQTQTASPPLAAMQASAAAEPVALLSLIPYQPAPVIAATNTKNPYLAYQQSYQQPFQPVDPAKLFSQFGDGLKMFFSFLPQTVNAALPAVKPVNPANPAMASQPKAAVAETTNTFNQIFTSLKMALPSLPLSGDAILPMIKTVYPTGEKPLVVLTFKCPTELIGITPLPTKALHELVNFGMDGINKSNLLSFNMQQVCS